VANWRREQRGTRLHLLPEAGQAALCGTDRADLGVIVYDTGSLQASNVCDDCSHKVLERTDDAIRLTARITSDAELEKAKDALRALVRVVPEGVTRDLVVYARACVVRGDLTGAHVSVKRWRAQMRAIGVFGQDA
jgi:hypothetical protein